NTRGREMAGSGNPGAVQAQFEATMESIRQQLVALEARQRELQGFQTLPGQMRAIPGAFNQPVPIMAHGGEVIGRPGGGVTVHMDNATFFGIDDAAQWVARMVIKARNLGAEI
ncbi:MAG TPA: hypothetical protein VFR55_04290, partial [Dehalococcoidia bacterium]|nr:hypothetical protein [Dehalococcoidia bacterium]